MLEGEDSPARGSRRAARRMEGHGLSGQCRRAPWSAHLPWPRRFYCRCRYYERPALVLMSPLTPSGNNPPSRTALGAR